MKLSWSYPETPYKPFWGPPSSVQNFCEEDYVVTQYLGEFISTLTSVLYVIYAYFGLRRQSRSSKPTPLDLQLPYYGLAAVGILSGAFHAILNYHSQMGDDLSMHFATTFLFQRAMTFDKSPKYRQNFALLMTAILVPFLIYHCVADEVILHQIVWGIMVVSVGVKARNLYLTRILDDDVKRRVNYISWIGRIAFVTGYALWQLDGRMCGTWIGFRRQIGMPWAFFLELHGYWHILTAIGAYTFMALIEFLTSGVPGQVITDDFAWPVGSLIPAKKNRGGHVD